ncbi:NUDIX hydrolase [Stutzerimonas azotifigens]|uniref:NUDIX hydrolase n=1 Tax=Stutzerimonas azotifigens TaxID=291995 RepID=UPI00041E1280|nr:NUDIX domain-containing protein [Stutzerimonas azotifigens]
MTLPTLTLAIACLFDTQGRVLLVRKRGTQTFMLPGGKAEPGESPRQTLARELEEELDVHLGDRDVEPLGRFEAPAANEPGHWVRAEAFLAPLSQAVQPLAELEELYWLDTNEPAPAGIRLAPLFERRVLPVLRKRLAARRDREGI